jgi:hypothetical protein
MAMIEILISLMQSICMVGYLYGAWLVITHQSGSGPARTRGSGLPVQRADEESAVWRRYLAYDS